MTKEFQDSGWPLPKFYFRVTLGSQDSPVLFQEVSGLETESQEIKYRHDDSNSFSTIKMPGIAKQGNITLKKGIFVKDNSFYDWYNSIKMNTIRKETVTIQLLDEKDNPAMTWVLTNAWPAKITGVDLKSDGNEIAVETIEISHEGLTIQNRLF